MVLVLNRILCESTFVLFKCRTLLVIESSPKDTAETIEHIADNTNFGVEMIIIDDGKAIRLGEVAQDTPGQ